jgi:hypothetical protein
MPYYHCTSAALAKVILKRGFPLTNGGRFRVTAERKGIADDQAELEIRVPLSAEARKKFKAGRDGWEVPADLLNEGKVRRLLSTAELTEKYNWWWRDYFAENKNHQPGWISKLHQAFLKGKTLPIESAGPFLALLDQRQERSARLYELLRSLLDRLRCVYVYNHTHG